MRNNIRILFLLVWKATTINSYEVASFRAGRTLETQPPQNTDDAQGRDPLQPIVTVVEGNPANRGFASVSSYEGSAWCNGLPTFWVTGHQKYSETPWCQVGPKQWEKNFTAVLDIEDVMNGRGIDRHFCVKMDVNKDGIMDLICGVGASKGKGSGYNELYLTNPNGTLRKIQQGHGLQKYTSMRTRYLATLKNRWGKEEFVFIGTFGRARADGRTNVHRMFRNQYTTEQALPYFKEVPGPWTYLFEATCAVAGDFTGDGVDDLVVCNQDGPPLLVRQLRNGTFSKVPIPSNEYTTNWRNVRIADVTGDGNSDLIVTYWTKTEGSQLVIFKGQTTSPYFNFDRTFVQMNLTYAAPDVEVLDVNSDGILDIYVVQADESKGHYCAPSGTKHEWGPGPFPPANWTPPLDAAHDVLLVGHRRKRGVTQARQLRQLPRRYYEKVTLKHSFPGCGWIAQRFTDTVMLLGQGSHAKAGHGLLLSW